MIVMVTCRPNPLHKEVERPVVLSGRRDDGSTISDDAYQRYCDSLERTLSSDFTVLIQKPFIVVGDEDPSIVLRRAEGTVKWAVDMLKQDYFSRDPADIITIWLFKDKESYYQNARGIFNDEPTTPFGYYLESDKALLMNISTGGGTLVHEIVHPFVSANFPACPPWFNEGLGSLYEQCGEKDGHIYAYTNWRLQGLQESIQADAVPPFKDLMSMNAHQFYTLDKGTNYGQARYLCYYLQEHGLLVTYYHEFYKNRLQDPTGYETLKKVLETDDMEQFKDDWELYVLALTFP
jgi:hypothetical protein